MNLFEALLHALKAHGAHEIFGIPGDFALPFFAAAEDSGVLPLYTLSHEPSVGFAADAAARLRGGLGVAAVTYGAGALNMVNAVAAAYAEKSPVVVISGAPGREELKSGLLLHHQAKAIDSQYRIYGEVTCAQARLDDARSAPREIARVLRECRTYSRPVYLEVPRDAGKLQCEAVRPAAPPAFDAEALAACADEILARLRASRSPVPMGGVEGRRFGGGDQVAALPPRPGIPVVRCTRLDCAAWCGVPSHAAIVTAVAIATLESRCRHRCERRVASLTGAGADRRSRAPASRHRCP
jgi:indolepyruvate decarboxylase